MKMLFISFLVTTTLLIYATQYAQAQDRSIVKIVPAFIRQSDWVNLSCNAPSTATSYCDFCISHCKKWERFPTCRLTLSGTDLIARSGRSGIVDIEVLCDYHTGTNTLRSDSNPVIVIGPPQLLVSHQVIRETDRVHLTCQTPQSALVSQCFFLVEGKALNNAESSCQLELTWKDLIFGWSGVRPPVQITLSCYYTIKAEQSSTPHLTSDPSQPVIITLVDGMNVEPEIPTQDQKSSYGPWTIVMVIVGIIMFAGGLITTFLCLKTRICLYKRPLANISLGREGCCSMGSRSPNTASGVMGPNDVQLSSTATATEMGWQDPDQDVTEIDYVYSTIPDIPNVSNQEECPYSVIHEYTHHKSNQNSIYNVIQMTNMHHIGGVET